jgi:cell division septation protein DedD
MPTVDVANPAAGLAKGPAKSGEYTIQVSSFQTAEEANAYAASLKRKGYAPYVVATQIAGKGTWHRVRLGAFATADAATLAKQHLVAADIAGWVVKGE